VHRTTWIALPIIGVLVLGSGFGIWSKNVYQQRQALASETESHYAGAFHTLVADMNDLTEGLGEAQISTDATGFRRITANVWRVSYGAQNEIGRLPIELMPMHQTQSYLADLSKQSNLWMEHPELLQQSKTQATVHRYYMQSRQLTKQLQTVQTQVLNDGLQWLSAEKATNQSKGDNQIVDGFRKMDGQLSSFVETRDIGKQVEGPAKRVKTTGKPLSPTDAIQRVSRWVGLPSRKDWRTESTTFGGQTPMFTVTGSTKWGEIRAVATQHGGQVLSFVIDSASANDNYGFAEAEAKAKDWATQRGIGKTDVQIANQYNHIGYFVLVPWGPGGWAVDSPISIKVALNKGEVIGFDGTALVRNPVPTTVPQRIYKMATLQKKLNSNFHVETSRPVVVRDSFGAVHSGWEFTGIHDEETYRVTMDAHDGSELSIQHLS